MIKTVLDYGAKLYDSNNHALSGSKSSHNAIMDMLADKGNAVLPPYGSLYLSDTVITWKHGDCITSLGQGNKGVNLVTDKPISMFLPINQMNHISGFTAYYVGDKITKECAVIRLGGDERNIGGIYTKPNGKEYHRWENRTTALGHNFDFDMQGDKQYYCSSISGRNANYNNDFIENGNAHAVWVDFDNEDESTNSHFHYIKIRGDWNIINTGLKLNRRKPSQQAMNNLDMKVHIDGARMYADIHGTLNRSTIIIDAQERAMLNFNKNAIWSDVKREYIDQNRYDNKEWQTPMFYIEGANLNCGIFAYDRHSKQENGRGRHKIVGQYNVKGLNLTFPLLVDENNIKVDAQFNDSTFRDNSVIKSIKGITI